MSGLIEEIQRDATNSSIPIESLLRRVKLAAAKLRLGSIESWVNDELGGYKSEVPDYRILHGQPSAWNPYNGWIPIQVEDPWLIDTLSTAKLGQSVSSLRDLVEKSSGTVHFPMPADFVNKLNEMLNYPTARIVIQLPIGSIVGILDAVQNKVLDWAIEMERNGVIGDGMSFDAIEVQNARSVMNNFNIGSIENFAGNMGTDNSSGDIAISQSNLSEIKNRLESIQNQVGDLIDAGATQNLKDAIDAAIVEAEQPEPDHSKLKSLIQDGRTALAGAAGNLTAEGALAVLGSLAKLLGGA